MDLAGTPSLPETLLPGLTQGRGDSVRLLCAADAASPAFRAAWDGLAANALEPNPFFETWFALPSLEQFAQHKAIKFLTVYEADCLIGLLPVGQERRYYGYPVPHLATWLHDNAFCGNPLIARGFETAFWRAALRHFDHTAGAALFLHLPQFPADGPANIALDSVLKETSRPSVTVEAGERAMLASDDVPGDYLAGSMSAKKRKELRRQHKRLAEEGTLTFERSADADNISAWITDFLALELAGWKGDAGSALASANDTRTFFADALTGAAQAGRLERLAMRLDGRPIAMLANFITPPGVFSFKTTFDEDYSRFSPGLLLQIENLGLLERPDVSWADSCAAEGHSMIERIWREKRPIISRNIAIGGALRRTAFKALMAYETRGQPKGHARP